MLVNICYLSDLLPLDIDANECTVKSLKSTIAALCGLEVDRVCVTFETREMTPDTALVKEFRVVEDDVLLVTEKPSASGGNALGVNALGVNASGGNAFGVNAFDPNYIASVARQVREELFGRDPAAAASAIQQRNRQMLIDQNLHDAHEHMPEAFVQVHMLYVKLKVNGVEIKAFVDSGCQCTLMSQACAAKCKLDHLIDHRFTGIARGVGESKIVGRVHYVDVEFHGVFLSATFTIVENQAVDVLFGLDLLRRHQCCIDLKRNCLVVEESIELPFLAESECPESAHA